MEQNARWKFKKYWIVEGELYDLIKKYKNKLLRAETTKNTDADAYKRIINDSRNFYSENVDKIKLMMSAIQHNTNEKVITIPKIKGILDVIYKLHPDF